MCSVECRWLVAAGIATSLVLAGCAAGGSTREPSCSDGAVNGAETDVDCGGPCGPCPTGATCAVSSDCASGGCCSGTCRDLLSDPANCGGCGIPCSLANASSACVAGDCTLASCSAGFDDCDGSAANGCEVDHSELPSAEEDLGAICGDAFCGFLCPASGWKPLASRTGKTSRGFRVRVDECSTCSAGLRARATLHPPPGVDFDLYAYDQGGAAVIESRNRGDAVEQVTFPISDNPGTDDSFWLYVYVVYWSGSGCGEWSLTVEGADC